MVGCGKFKKAEVLLNLKHIQNDGLTTGGNSLMSAYAALFDSARTCKIYNPGYNVTGFSYSSTMPADEYGIYSAYRGVVSFTAMTGTDYLDSIRTIWDNDSAAFAYYGACPPHPIIYPYPITVDSPTNDDVFLVKFITQAAIENYTGEPVWSELSNLDVIKFSDIKGIDDFYLEDSSGSINRKYPSLYQNKGSALGIVCIITLKNNKTIPAYIITNDMQPYPVSHVLWKK